MSDQKWFSLRGEQYQYDGRCWWKRESSETLSVPCSQPFRVGDRVKVVRALNSSLIGQTFVIDRVTGVDTWGHGCWIPLQNLEPAEPEPQTPDVSQESQNDDTYKHVPMQKIGEVQVQFQAAKQLPPRAVDDDGWEIYEPVEKQPYSPGTQYKIGDIEWRNQSTAGRRYHGEMSIDKDFIYRRPIQKQQPARKPLDVHLPEIERKVVLAAKDNPELLDWWRAEKERLAIEAGRRMSNV